MTSNASRDGVSYIDREIGNVCRFPSSSSSFSGQVISHPDCLLCSQQGVELYDNLVDWLFGVSGRWGISHCPRCDVAWLDPQPPAEEISKLYARYYTHETGGCNTYLARLRHDTHRNVLGRMGYKVQVSSRLLPRLLSLIPSVRRAAALDVLGLSASTRGTLLDVGCGNGEFLVRMRSFGWQTSGVDPDPAAVFRARTHGIEAFVGSINDAPGDICYDVITLNHVIEHAADPVDLLNECRKRLRLGTGRLIITTPNLNSLGHSWFKSYWRGLEVPRHLVLFSKRALGECVKRAGLTLDILRTETRLARMIYSPSVCSRKGETDIGEKASFPLGTKIGAYVFQAAEDSLMYFTPGIGEEVFCVCLNQGQNT